MDPRIHKILAALDVQVGRKLLTGHRPDVDWSVQPSGVVRIVALNDTVPIRLVALSHSPSPIPMAAITSTSTHRRLNSLGSVPHGPPNPPRQGGCKSLKLQ